MGRLGLGSVYQRCGCWDPGTGRRRNASCPSLGDPGHGSWYFSLVRRGGYPARAAAEAACRRLSVPGGPGRRGEVLTVLAWIEIYLDAGLAHVTRQICYSGGRLAACALKTAASRRVVALDPATVAALRRHRRCFPPRC